MKDQAVVLFSGGQDSTTCLAWAIERWGIDAIWPLSFDYGQRQKVELQQAGRILERLDPRAGRYLGKWMIMPVPQLAILAQSALTSTAIPVEAEATREGGNSFAAAHGLPSTFVPGRNLLFFTLAAAYGMSRDARHIVTGVCEADRAGYPDCRIEFVGAAERALVLALDEPVYMHTPLIARDKAQTWQLAHDLGILDLIIEESHTCYHGDRDHRHAWGYGCGQCPACHERARGWDEFAGLPSSNA